MSDKRFTARIYSEKLVLDFKSMCQKQGVKTDFVIRSLMYYFVNNYSSVCEVISTEKFKESLYISYPEVLESPLLRRYRSLREESNGK